MRGQRSPVGLARSRCPSVRPHGIEAGLYGAQRCVEFLERQLQLILIDLLRARSEAVALKGSDDRGQPCDHGIGIGTSGFKVGDSVLALDDYHLALSDRVALLGDSAMRGNNHCAQRVRVVRKVGLEQHRDR